MPGTIAGAIIAGLVIGVPARLILPATQNISSPATVIIAIPSPALTR